MTDRINILEDDISKNTLQVFTSVTTFALTVRIGMWGADMFGSPTILGAGMSTTSQKEKKNVVGLGNKMNVITV